MFSLYPFFLCIDVHVDIMLTFLGISPSVTHLFTSYYFCAGTCYFDLSLGEAFHCTVSEVEVVQLFESCQDLRTKVAILHYAVVETRNLALTKKVGRI